MIEPNWYPGRKQLRQFAAASLVGFALIGYFVVYRKVHSLNGAYACAAIGILSFLVGMVRPESIRPLYALLMGLTLPIGWLISAVFLRIIFYGFFTPIGIVFKIAGRDPLKTRKPAGASFWIDHRDRTDSESYFRQA